MEPAPVVHFRDCTCRARLHAEGAGRGAEMVVIVKACARWLDVIWAPHLSHTFLRCRRIC